MSYFANCARKLLSMTCVFMLINTEMVACTKLNWQFQLPAGNRLYRPQTFQILTKRLLKRFWAPIFLSRSYVTLQFDVCLLIWGILCQVSLPVTKVKHAALSPELELELTEICRCYKSLLNLIGRIEGTSYSIMQAYRDLHALQFHEDPCSISEYISNRLLGKDFVDIINCTRENITPAMFSQLQQCCATSCAVERSFSLLKKLLSKERNFLPDNLKKYFIFYYNHAAKEIQWIVPYTPFQIKSYIKSYFDKR